MSSDAKQDPIELLEDTRAHSTDLSTVSSHAISLVSRPGLTCFTLSSAARDSSRRKRARSLGISQSCDFLSLGLFSPLSGAPERSPPSPSVGALDRLAIGGLTELFGPSGVGKSQLCIQAAIECAQVGCRSLLVDCSHSLDSSRLRDLANRRRRAPLTASEILAKISIVRALDLEALTGVIKWIRATAMSAPSRAAPFRLLVLDSLTGILTPALGASKRGHALIWQLIRHLKRLAFELQLSVLLVTAGEETRAVLGEAWAHQADKRIFLEPGESPALSIKLIKDTQSASGAICSAVLTGSGIVFCGEPEKNPTIY